MGPFDDLGYDLSALVVLQRSSLRKSADAMKVAKRVKGADSKAVAVELVQGKLTSKAKSAKKKTVKKASAKASSNAARKRVEVVRLIGRIAGPTGTLSTRRK